MSSASEQKSCDMVSNGSLILLRLAIRIVAQQIVDTVSSLLQSHPKAGTMALQVTPLAEMTKAP